VRFHLLRPIEHGCAGTAAIEFAMLAPLFLVLLFGTIEFGRLLWTKQALQEAATAGARCMAIAQGSIPNGSCVSGGSYSSSQTQTYVQQQAGNWGISLPTADITPNNNATCGGTTGFSQVSIASTFSSVVPKLVDLSGAIALNASACYPNNL
jgi:Flp pilus assembly protein TadG